MRIGHDPDVLLSLLKHHVNMCQDPDNVGIERRKRKFADPANQPIWETRYIVFKKVPFVPGDEVEA